MLQRIAVRGFKSLRDVRVELAPLVVVFGPNAAGKSNLLESLVLLSRLVRERTLADAFNVGIRGYPSEAFSMGDVSEVRRDLCLEVELDSGDHLLRYRAGVSIELESGKLALTDELLARLTQTGGHKGNPTVERVEDYQFHIRRKGKGSHPYTEGTGLGHTNASNLQYSGVDRFPDFEALRAEVGAWRAVYLDPREAMRRSQPPREVEDIGERGEYLVPFLHRLQVNVAWKKHFEAIVRATRSLIPSVQSLETILAKERGEIDLFVTEDGLRLPARVVSEGTLRVLALCAMAASPFPMRMLAFEEPENGVHPRRIASITQLLVRASQQRQVVVTTHSPLVIGEVLRMLREQSLQERDVRLLQCSTSAEGTVVRPFRDPGALYDEAETGRALVTDDDLAQGALVRGWLDA